MCNEESHNNLSTPEHFVRHTMKVEQARAMTCRGLGGFSIEQVMTEARDALELVGENTPTECTKMLELAAEGDLQATPAS